ncbi:hypothetical protein EI427_21075 [Flammeovirga pectinis]|uniref:Uncharacterized protein n=1 Tax=Flammeovirga pectinis TaxID=2494373 RepID=A0A3Q9FQG4_9BACT|nr:hypothetical protein [Flammeovirga pectinis]AZQ64719.1 hypothetical protein EI427_21075 [Flammeovirga pectinis]
MLVVFYSFGQQKNSETKETQIKKSIENIDVIITQYKSLIESPNIPYCRARIEILESGKKIDSIEFSEIEPVGGHYGLLVYNEIIKDHIVISKFGDYDGQTIIINGKGEKFLTIGGCVSVDNDNGLLFSIYNSDLAGFSIFDLNKDKEIFKMTDIEDRPQEFYKYSNNRFLYKASNDETDNESIWEIEFEMDRIMQLDLRTDDVKGKELRKLSDCKEININCE